LYIFVLIDEDKMKETFKILITDFIEKNLDNVYERDLTVPLNSKKIVSVIGARRVGKTYFLFSLINRIRKKTTRDRVAYINFEDDRLFPLTIREMNLFVEAYYELFPNNKGILVYFFFDEIQNVEKWELFVRRIYDSERCTIFISGSSSKLLSREIATSLRGRTISYELFPYSFKEYLRIKNTSLNYYSSETRVRIINLFNKYLKGSSFPEVVDSKGDEKRRILNEYYNLIIYKDLVERYNITNLF